MIDITFTSDPLPADFSGTLEDFRQRFLINLHGSISETQVLIGQINGAKPLTNAGPWLNNDTWYIWNGTDYVPATIKVGGADYQVTLSNQFAGTPDLLPDKIQTLQDRDGVIALLSDVYEGRPTVILTGTTPVIDWGLGHHFFGLLEGHTTPQLINAKDGQKIAVAFRNGATAYGITWPANIFWAGGTPTQSVTNKTDLYIIRNIGGSLLGRQIAGYP